MESNKQKKDRRRFRYGSLAAVFTAIVTIIVVVINVGLHFVSGKEGWVTDFTQAGNYELSKETLNFIGALEQKVEITVLTKEENYAMDITTNGYLTQASRLLSAFEKHAAHISLRYIDPNENPGIMQKYRDLKPMEGDIVVSSGDQARLIQSGELFNTYSDGASVYLISSRVEQQVDSAILAVTSEDGLRVVILTGLSDTHLEGLESLLRLNNFTVEERSFLEGDLPQEADILILAAPMYDITAEQAQALSAFLGNGGHLGKTLLYFAEYTQPETPVLDAFLKDWGIFVGQDAIYETAVSNLLSSENTFSTLADYVENPYSADLIESDLRVILPRCRAIEILFQTSGGRSVAPLLTFGNGAHLFDHTMPEGYQPSDQDPRGPFNGAVISTQIGAEKGESVYSQVVAVGSADSIARSYLESTLVSNASYYTELLNTLYQKEPAMQVEAKTLDPALLKMDEGQARFYQVVFIWVLPAVIILGGLAEWLRRRRL